MANELKRLIAAASSKTCEYGIMKVGSASTGPEEDIAYFAHGSFPRTITHDRSRHIVASVMALIAHLVNHAQNFVALIEASRAIMYDDKTENIGKLAAALAPFAE